MAKKGAACGNAIMGLPWILRVLLAIFLDCVLGICRFIDGIFQGKILFLYILTDSDPELREKIRRLRIVFFPGREYNADVF